MAAKKAVTGSIINADAVSGYHVSKDVRTASGRKAVDSNDAVAKELRGVTFDGLKDVCAKNGMLDRWNGTGDYREKRAWKDLNPGQARMAVGNALRALKRAGTKVKTPRKAKAKKAVKKAA